MDIEKDFTTTKIDLKPDAEGINIATLIACNANTGNRNAVLYVHGFIDYFFQTHVAQAFIDHNIDFYALDLRKYGRSILPHQTPNYCENLEEYFEEITKAIQIIQKNNSKKLFLLGHSTGCTTLSLYMNKGSYKNEVSALILNSPFLEMPQSRLLTRIMYRTGKIVTKFRKMTPVPRTVNQVYPQTLHKKYNGEWDYDLTLKPYEGFKGYFKWAIAIVDAQKFLQTQSRIRVPVLLMHSKKSAQPKSVNKKAFSSDIVLNVKHMKKHGKNLGNKVTLLYVKNGLHDLFLSPKPAREYAIKSMFNWLKTI